MCFYVMFENIVIYVVCDGYVIVFYVLKNKNINFHQLWSTSGS
jgi:hypothetical protein